MSTFSSDLITQSQWLIWWTRFCLLTTLSVLCIVYFQADSIAKLLSSKVNKLVKPSLVFGFVLFLSFVELVSMGITGSSLQLGAQQTPFVQTSVINVWGGNQHVRSDEWDIVTPLALAQYNHQPKFPIENTNLGEDGHNMLVIGMAGVPVAHISAIAKPATWGFFLFDLKRALSWYWYFPIFACLLAIWGVVALLLPEKWRASFLIALWFSTSPYLFAWSHWPAYAVFFPSLALLCAIAILKSHNKYLSLACGGILGVTLAGFVLVLYPPWQVSLGYVFIAIFIGLIIRDRLYENINRITLASYSIAIIFAGLILWAWWLTAHQAINAVLATIYPGQRSAVVGGSVAFSDYIRGFTNFVTLHKIDPAYSNQSEIASFFYWALPLCILFAFRIYQRAITALEIALAIVIAFILYFMLIGIPAELAKLSFWGRVPANRADLALGLSSLVLCGLLLSFSPKPTPNEKSFKILILVVALSWASIVILNIHTSILVDFPRSFLVGLFIFITLGGYLFALGKLRGFIYLNLALTLGMVWSFNPINIAPNSVSNMLSVESYGSNRRTLVLETQVPAMYLLASGAPVANGVFFYPQSSLWARLDMERTGWNKYNRFQNLLFYGGIADNVDHFRIESPRADVVIVTVDLQKFDFHMTGAGLLLAPSHDEPTLRKNIGLTYLRSEKGWALFQINGA